MPRLPPLNALRAFEVAARHGSFKRAAAELNVTHGAVSHQIALLESWLKIPLFRRLNRQVVLTDEGKSLSGDITPAMERIALAVASLAREKRRVNLTISAPPTFIMRWLIPRLPGFLALHRGIEVRLAASIAPVNFSAADYDVAIRRSTKAPAGLKALVFLSEMLVPVCTPSLLERAPLHFPQDLSSHVLIHTATSPSIWPEWLASMGVPNLRTDDALRFDELFFSLQAASSGLGIAMAPAALVADDIMSGRLVCPFAKPFRQGNDYCLLYAPLPEKAEAIADLQRWLVEQGVESAAQVTGLLAE